MPAFALRPRSIPWSARSKAACYADEPRDPLIALRSIRDKLATFRLRAENWDNRGSAAPDATAIDDALAWIEEIYGVATSLGLEWIAPAVSSSEDGEVVFEWWRGGKKLTIYVSQNGAQYIKAWGPHIEEDMEDGDLIVEGVADLWTWLTY